jgi:hypothetical protein
MLDIQAITMYLEPNDYSVAKNWKVTQGVACTLYFQVLKQDELPTRRFIVAAGQTIKVKFQRAKKFQTNQDTVSQTFEVTAIAVATDRSLWSIALTADQVNQLVSGTVNFTIYNATVVVDSIVKNYFIQKQSTSAGQ